VGQKEMVCVSSKVIRTPNLNGGLKPRSLVVGALLNPSLAKR
jgi:hypothetical protein